MKFKRHFILLLITLFILLTGCQKLNSPTSTHSTDTSDISKLLITSPNELVEAIFEIDSNGRPKYSVHYKDKVIIAHSSMGFRFRNTSDMVEGMMIIGSETNTVDETWNPVWGEKSTVRNHYQELTIHLKETRIDKPRYLDIIFRVYNDGVGFRYVLPEQLDLKTIEIMSEETEFQFTNNHTTWWIPNDWDSYEYLYSETPLSQVNEVNTPFTLRTAEGTHITIHEAQLIDYAGMALKKKSPMTLGAHLAPWPDGVKVKGVTPLITPWRTIQIGDDAGDLVESDLIENLNDPCAIEDTSWIKPMKYMGIWWEMHIKKSTWESGPLHGATTDNAKYYIDFIDQHFDTEKEPIGLLVEGWNIGWDGNWMDNGHQFDFTTPYPDFNLEEVVQYARDHGVYYIMHNETSGDILNYESQMDSAYDYYESLGIHMIKSGYVADSGMKNPEGQHHHGQYMVNHYNNAVIEAAKHKIMINTHEPIKDTGLHRTYPNWVSREGVQGMEYNAWSAGNPPEHTTILPFTRMMAGPIDYTPGIFNVNIDEQPSYRVYTTRAKQLALYVIISSPIQMVTDLPENYLDGQGNILPEFQFIKAVPTTWDDILVPAGVIGDYLTIVRRDDNEIFMGSITDEYARSWNVPLDFLDSSTTYVAEIYYDDIDVNYLTNPDGVLIQKRLVTKDDLFSISLATSGGQAVRMYPATENDLINIPFYQQPTTVLSYDEQPSKYLSNQPFTRSVLVTNTGNVITGEVISLTIDGKVVDSQTLRIAPNETKKVTFFIPGLYEVKDYIWSINELVPQVLTIEEREATFVYSQLETELVGNVLRVRSTVTNLGSEPGSVTVPLIVNNHVVAEQTVSLGTRAFGYNKPISFEITLEPGVYEVTIGDQPADVILYPTIDLTSNWLFIRGDNLAYKEMDIDTSTWSTLQLPMSWEQHDQYYDDYVYGWYRKEIYIPSEWRNYTIQLTLGKIDDVDQTFINGVQIGQSGIFPDPINNTPMITAWDQVRTYTIPNELIQYDSYNVISIRVYDATVGGGVYEGPIEITLTLPEN